MRGFTTKLVEATCGSRPPQPIPRGDSHSWSEFCHLADACLRAHRHVGNDEAYFVLDGVVEFHVGDDLCTGSNGMFLLVSAGEAHTFGNTSAEFARLLVIHTPALDAYFADLERLWSAAEIPDRDTEIALMKQYGMEPA